MLYYSGEEMEPLSLIHCKYDFWILIKIYINHSSFTIIINFTYNWAICAVYYLTLIHA